MHQRVFSRRVLLISVLSLISLAAIGSTLLPASTTTISVSTVENWLYHVDAHDSNASWQEASSFFQEKLSKEKWETIVKTTRAPIGTVIRRRHTVTQYASHLPGIPDGTYAILQFHSTFTGKESTVETVVFSKESDGQWRAIGYSMK
ncbi:MAG: DUF4019 domain-containing protein [Nitrospirae bacterium]|nr:DUF4019 domain-containing protein [Nitrospirota bacterium]MBU6482734.1 DUF4019 domain-containing protein [Nitrospirota bacterium]MDE3039000.1 DUF4019 domain-containing protein [Nitrospirota bacterium]MDE3219203.1 DUF4019 domain-containing protein [Nitrospirota bacterium]